MAWLSFQSAGDRRFVRRVGVACSEVRWAGSLCAHVESRGALLLADARSDPRFGGDPLVNGPDAVRFYCGVTVPGGDGHPLAVLSVSDRTPRPVDVGDIARLAAFCPTIGRAWESCRQLERAERARAEASERQRVHELLAAMLVHDLRSPVTTIRALCQAIAAADEESATDLAAVEREARRMGHMLADILDVQAQRAGGLHPRPVAFDLRAILHDVAALYGRTRPGATVGVSGTDEPALVRADPELVRRVLDNLVDNALHHAGPEVSLRCWRHADRVGCEVRDHGAPIAEADLPALFHPLERGPVRRHHGHGLGLAFCRMAVEAQGGTLCALPRSSPPGNAFRFELPAADTPCDQASQGGSS
ncbi:MAG: HAMP domain-containing histidine kinase [Myxococcales bacterium]|nr:HAMP domain-containing histidine kinase [Myxococcales bacterium]